MKRKQNLIRTTILISGCLLFILVVEDKLQGQEKASTSSLTSLEEIRSGIDINLLELNVR